MAKKAYTATYTVDVRIVAESVDAAATIAHGLKTKLKEAARIEGKTTAKIAAYQLIE